MRLLLDALQAVFSILVWALSFTSMGICVAVGLLLSPIWPWRKTYRWNVRYFFGTLPFFTLSRVEVIRDPRLDRKRISVFCQNHVSILDGSIAGWVGPHAFAGLHLKKHFKIPFYGWIMRLSLSIGVDPERKGQIGYLTEALKERAALGLSLITYPEGHRSRDGKVGPFRTGVFFMARDAGLPVVPIATRGLNEVNPAGSWRFRPGRIVVYLGHQYETEGLDDAGVEALAQEVRGVIAAFAERAELPEGARGPEGSRALEEAR